MKRLTWIRKRIKFILVLFALLSVLSYASYYYVTTTWIVSNPDPSVTLDFPLDDVTINVNTTEFNWTGDGGNATLRYVFYIDSIPTFTSPNLRAINRYKNTSYTPEPLEDGHWYWRVEVSDGEQINASETRHLIVNTVPPNNFPSLTNMLLSPSSGTTSTLFYYNVTYTDIDNNSAAYVRVYIDGNPYDLSEVNPSDSNVTDGKAYTYSTTLNTSSHTYLFMCSDGNATNVTALYNGPSVTQSPPLQDGEAPGNNSIDKHLLPSLHVICIDYDEDTMTATWYSNSSGTWLKFATNSSITNNTNITQTNANFSAYNTTYYWSVNLTDGTDWLNVTYNFKTLEEWINTCPTSVPDPANNSEVSMTIKYWNVTITDYDLNLTTGSIECSNGNSTNWTNQPDGLRSLELNTTLGYNTIYYVWVNYTDGHCVVNETFIFTTLPRLALEDFYPSHTSTDECPQWVSLCVSVIETSPSMVNLTFYSNWSGVWEALFTIDGCTFKNVSSREYCIAMPYFVKYNTKYYWYANITDNNTYFNSSFLEFTTAESPDSCLGTGQTKDDTWILGVSIVFSVFGIIAFARTKHMKKKKRPRDPDIDL